MPYPTPLHDAEGKLVGAINMLVDISHRKEAENRQKVLIDELNHRVKNTLTTVQSLAGQTARHADDVPDFMQRFGARVFALARAHDLLSRRYWQEAPLKPLAREVLGALTEEADDKVRIEGPCVSLKPRAALSLTMALNELGTNAAKYGALSDRDGSLAVTWRRSAGVDESDAMLEILWEERGVKTVKAPSRQGFGMRLVERCIEGDLEGRFEIEFNPDGVCCRMTIPAAVATA
jgi:two-component sensor histidine kinase